MGRWRLSNSAFCGPAVAIPPPEGLVCAAGCCDCESAPASIKNKTRIARQASLSLGRGKDLKGEIECELPKDELHCKSLTTKLIASHPHIRIYHRRGPNKLQNNCSCRNRLAGPCTPCSHKAKSSNYQQSAMSKFISSATCALFGGRRFTRGVHRLAFFLSGLQLVKDRLIACLVKIARQRKLSLRFVALTHRLV